MKVTAAATQNDVFEIDGTMVRAGSDKDRRLASHLREHVPAFNG